MGKKTREEKEAASDIFKILFGNSNGEGPHSLFLDNPYRRKSQAQNPNQEPLGLGLGFESGAASDGGEGNPINANSLSPTNQTDLVEPKKKKREREKKPSSDTSDSEVGKKRKKPAVDDATTVKVDEDSGIRKRKKKRKRDELEEEYETRKYGVEVEKKIEDEEARLGRKLVGEKRKAADDSKEMVVSKEGFDDESKLQRTIFVGNLPLKLKRKALLKEFKQFGEIESVRIRSVPLEDTKMPRKGAVIKGKINDFVDSVHAYIVFKDEKSVQAALSNNMAKVGDNHIRVDRACPPRKKLKGDNAPYYDNKRTVFIGNLPFDVKDEEIYQLFCGVNQLESSIEAIRVIRDPNTSLGKGIAYIMFKTREAANLIVKKRNLKLRNRDLRLYHAKSDSTPSKRDNPVPAWQDSSPGKRLAVDSGDRPFNSSKPKAKAASLSYQGLRASKSGAQKKVTSRPRIDERRKSESKRQGLREPKVRQTKRPAVAARKEKTLRLASADGKVKAGGGGAAKQDRGKRKLESRTPESSHRHKKARKFK